MNAEQAILEVCQRFCSTTGDAHDDACVALREEIGIVTAQRDRAELRHERLESAVEGLIERADARADVDRRLVTTTALRAALLTGVTRTPRPASPHALTASPVGDTEPCLCDTDLTCLARDHESVDSEHAPEPCIAPPGNLCTDTGCWDADRCVIPRKVGVA